MSDSLDVDHYLAARADMIACVENVLAHHRPERNPTKRIVTCTKVYDDTPHAQITTQWPGWREHVAPLIVDALLARMLPAQEVESVTQPDTEERQ